MSDLSKCGDACNCMYCRMTHTPSEALRELESNLPVIDEHMLNTLEPEDLSGIPVRVDDSTIEFIAPVLNQHSIGLLQRYFTALYWIGGVTDIEERIKRVRNLAKAWAK